MKRASRKRGFTLIEVLLVLTLISLMAGMAIFAMWPQKGKADIDITKITLNDIAKALDVYNMNIGHYPTDEEGGLDALMTKPGYSNEALNEKWAGPYLRKVPLDAWNNPIKYQMNAAGSSEAGALPFKLWSTGPDSQDGTEDDIVYGASAATTK